MPGAMKAQLAEAFRTATSGREPTDAELVMELLAQTRHEGTSGLVDALTTYALEHDLLDCAECEGARFEAKTKKPAIGRKVKALHITTCKTCWPVFVGWVVL